MRQTAFRIVAVPAFLLLSIAPTLRAQSLAPAAALRAQLTASPAAGQPAASLADRRKALNDLFHDYWEDLLKHDPEFASTIGDLRYNDQISDYSVQAINDGLAREQRFELRLAAIDPTGFTDQEKISQELLLRQFDEDQQAAEFKEWEMPLTQMDGIHAQYPRLVAELSFNTVKDYDDWIARLHALPHAFDQVTTNMEIGMDDHRVPPKYLLQKALEQVKQLANQKPEDSPLALPLKNFPASISATEQARIKSETLDAISKEVLPAYTRFARFLEVSYIPAGRDKPGIDALPDGAKYYQFLIKRTTTTNLTAAQIHQIGLDEVGKDEAEMTAIAQKLGFKDLASFRATPQEQSQIASGLGRRARRGLQKLSRRPCRPVCPSSSARCPRRRLKSLTVPDYAAKTSAPAYYESGTPDGSRPGRLFIDTYDATHRNLYSVESIAYHEGIPGHHLQISIQQELTGVPEFRKFGEYTAYTEGWAFYSEHLGKDIGLYQDPYSDYGRLENETWRAIRLVIDTGVHSEGWTRDQMVQYFRDHSAIDEPSMQAEVDRYVAWPSQALAYKIGQLKILELRDRAKKALGDKFDIRAFHDQVIDSGALPLDVLERRIDDWLMTQSSAAAPAAAPAAN